MVLNTRQCHNFFTADCYRDGVLKLERELGVGEAYRFLCALVMEL